jgi:hypothetical protein
MTKKERRLAANLLRLASDQFCNHGCNDLDKKTIAAAGFTDEEATQFAREYCEWNGDPDWPKHFHQMQDFALMDFLAYKLEQETE